VSGVRARLQPALQPEDAPAHAHRPQALRVPLVQEGFPPQLRPAQTRADARRGRPLPRGVAGRGRRRRTHPRPLSQERQHPAAPPVSS